MDNLSEVRLVGSSLRGMIETYGFQNVIGQTWEKLVLDPQRYARVHGEDAVPAPRGRLITPGGHRVSQAIFLLCHCYFPDSAGGTERFARNLASALLQDGNQVYILAYSARVHTAYPFQASGILYSEETIDGIPVIRFRHRSAPAGILKDFPACDPEMEAFAAFLIQKYRPDIVHFLHLSRVNAFAAACRDAGIPYGVTLTDFFAVCHFYTRVDRTGRICPNSMAGKRCGSSCPVQRVKDSELRYQNAARLLYSAKWVAAPSSYAAGVFQREFPGLEVAVIPHGIEDIRRESGRGGAVRRFAFVGKLTAIKGVSGLIRAFRRMPEGCTLDIYGEGPALYKRKLRRLAGGDACVTFHGAAPPNRIGEVYRQTDCVVIPSLVPESYNFVVREALQCGCLAVAARIGALPEAVSENENGFLFACGDLEELYRAMMRAYRFRWQDYQPAAFPGARQEADEYYPLYSETASERNGSHE